MRNLISSRNILNRFYSGLALGFLPCGLVYMALLRSVVAGTALSGATSMLAFGLGTSGALVALGFFSSAVKLRFNRFGSRVAAVSVMALGVFLIFAAHTQQALSLQCRRVMATTEQGRDLNPKILDPKMAPDCARRNVPPPHSDLYHRVARQFICSVC